MKTGHHHFSTLLAVACGLTAARNGNHALCVAAFATSFSPVAGGLAPYAYGRNASPNPSRSPTPLGLAPSMMPGPRPPGSPSTGVCGLRSASPSWGRRLPRSRVGSGGATATSINLFIRGGGDVASSASGGAVASLARSLGSSPSNTFNAVLISLLAATAALKLQGRSGEGGGSDEGEDDGGDGGARSLQLRFLPVFYLLRMADWLQGPYFYEVYASKVFNGQPASFSLVSKLFLTGFASTAIFGPIVGRMADSRGRKRGTLAFTALYALGAWSTRSTLLLGLFLGRVASGIGTSLLFSAPESWLVGEAQRMGKEKYLGETFGLAYAGDSIVAIIAGQLAALAATKRGGPTGPFELSVVVLALGAALTAVLWKENVATPSSEGKKKATIRDAMRVIKSDPKIALVGAVQSLFEAAMYIFVLQWPPAVSGAISGFFGRDAATPYGTVFSCFMACCLLGSTIFGKLAAASSEEGDGGDGKNVVSTESSTGIMLLLSTLAMGGAVTAVTAGQRLPFNPLLALVPALFVFEACVGFYFPSIGTLRSKYVPDSHRSVIMNLFGIPLNVLVVSVFLGIKRLGVEGALSIATSALGVATLCMWRLQRMTNGTGNSSGAALEN